MATIQGDKIRGTIGNWVYSIDPVTKKQMVRHKPKKVRNPKTAGQQTHRNAFIDIVRLSSHMTEAHLLGLHRHAQRMKLRTYTDFRRLNKDCFTSDGLIDYPRIVVSRGPVDPVFVNGVHVDDDHTLRITFGAGLTLGNAHPDDTFHLFAYCPVLETVLLAPPVMRTDEVITLSLPADWPAGSLHLYAFLRDRTGRTSETIYIPVLER